MGWIRARVTYANVVATLALVVALTGGAYAAVTLPANSIRSAQIAPNGVRAADIAPNSITSAKVKDRSLLARDFRAGQLPAGPQGPAGPAGATGPQGARGPSDGFVFTKASDSITTPTSKTIGSLTLPAGRYLVNAKALISASTQAGFVDCVLTNGGTTVDQAQFYLPAGGGAGSPSDEHAVLAAGVDLPAAATLDFVCQRANAQSNGISADDIVMTAIRVETLTATAG